jgi:hypothetical protein
MQNTIKPLTTSEKHKIYIQKKFKMLYGTGRPIFNITEDNQHIRKYNNTKYYSNTNIMRELYNNNNNFIGNTIQDKCID